MSQVAYEQVFNFQDPHVYLLPLPYSKQPMLVKTLHVCAISNIVS